MMEYEKYNVRKDVYNNATRFKYDNRRLTVLEREGTYFIDFRTMKNIDVPKASTVIHRNKIAQTTVALSKEGAELLMFALAETLGLQISITKK